jgi:hypothetical protein
MKITRIVTVLCLVTLPLLAADDEETPAKPANGRKVEKPVNFIFAKADPAMGDYEGNKGDDVAQVVPTGDGTYQANILSAFDKENNVVTSLKGSVAGDSINFTGEGWTGAIKDSNFTLSNSGKNLTLHHITRTSPTMGAQPPKGAIVLFDGKNLDAWAKKAGKDWLTEDGPAKWKLLDGAVTEVVPGSDCIITHEKFGDCHVHVEFRTLGTPSNSGVFLEDRYEANINETYGKTDGSPNAGFDNCTDNIRPRIRPCFPPLAWQTFDIDFQAPRFDANGKKTANAAATVLFNGVKIYDHQQLDQPHGAAHRLGEAPTGPLMLQEHGMPVQFRNIWLVETH